VLKVFTHPLRIKLYRILRATDPATASQLAVAVEENVALVSYHLRKLAVHGFIEEVSVPEGDARQRWWKVSSAEGVTIRDSDFSGDPEGAAVYAEVRRLLSNDRHSDHQLWTQQRTDLSQEWADASFDSDFHADLSSDELSQLGAELIEVLQRWRDREHHGDDSDTDRRRIAIQLCAHPELR